MTEHPRAVAALDDDQALVMKGWSGRRESNPHRELGKQCRAAHLPAVMQVRHLGE
jgi:hypothetical protein